MLEALLGQIYLVTVVALLVSNLRRPTQEERRQSAQAHEPEPEPPTERRV